MLFINSNNYYRAMSVIYLFIIYASKNKNIVLKSLTFIPLAVHQYGEEVKFSNPPSLHTSMVITNVIILFQHTHNRLSRWVGSNRLLCSDRRFVANRPETTPVFVFAHSYSLGEHRFYYLLLHWKKEQWKSTPANEWKTTPYDRNRT